MAATMIPSTTDTGYDGAQSGHGLHFEPRWTPQVITGGGDGPRGTTSPRLSGAVYWRRRLAAGLLLVVLGAGLWTIATWMTNSSVGVAPVGADRSGPATQEIHVVQPGETLWSIASEVDPGGDVRATVDRLADLNGGAAIQVGQRLIIDG